MRINLMFSRGIDVVLEYRVVSMITNDSLLKRTMSVVNAKFPVILGLQRAIVKKRFSQVAISDNGLSGNP